MKIFEKLKSKLDLDKGWLPFINQQLKWGLAFFIRIATVVITILFVLFLIKWSGIVTDIRSLLYKKLEITPKNSNVISSPDINYDKDLRSLGDIIDMLESKRKGNNDGTKKTKVSK